jgi:predicted O-methyltransferase YrrM
MEQSYMRSDALIAGLRDLIRQIKPNSIIIEIGSYAGESTEIFAEVGKIVYAVDPWQDNYDSNLKLRPMKEMRESFDRRLSRFNNVVPWQMTSEEASKRFSDNSIDVVYIDGDHRFEFVKKDLELWLPKLKEDGIISGHDYSTNSVKKAIKEVIGDQTKKFLFRDDSWLIFKLAINGD